jgi:uncharacterized protein (TIGR02301 family)
MKSVLFILAILFAPTFLVLPVAAQTVTDPTQTPELDPEATTGQLENRIDNNMVTMTGLVEAMSNNLGQLHFLRTLCFGDDDQKWRVEASNMMQIEAPNDLSYRSQLIRAFNAGYYDQKERYKSCTTKVALDVAALSENGRHLSTMLGDPYRER